MKKVDKSSSAIAKSEGSTKDGSSQVCQSIAKPNVSRIKTPISVKAGNHIFLRYLMSNEYAEEMKCSKCGFVIWPCQNEDEAKRAVNDLCGDANCCG